MQVPAAPLADLSPSSLLAGTAAPCRLCGADLVHVVIDLGMSPPCESFVPRERLNDMEPFFPLVVYLCDECHLVQLQEYIAPEAIFSDYAYFSSYSDSWVEHARCYVHDISGALGLDGESLVVELASNDGYLLRHFLPRGIPVLGVEPARNVARVARELGVRTETVFFGAGEARRLAAQYGCADLVVANNVLAQVPDLHDFLAGVALLLKGTGTITIEVPHVLHLLNNCEFDTIYHEHFSYFSVHTLEAALAQHDLEAFDAEELPTHGGSIRLYAAHRGTRRSQPRLRALRAWEREAGILDDSVYDAFGAQVASTKRDILTFLIEARRAGKTVAGYGAPGKGNTLLNYCGIRSDLIPFTVDRNPRKQGKFLPGTHIPILAPEAIADAKPDYVFILPWNLRDELIDQLSYIREWGGKFVMPIPKLEVVA